MAEGHAKAGARPELALSELMASTFSHFYHVTPLSNLSSFKDHGLSLAHATSLAEDKYAGHSKHDGPSHFLCTEECLPGIKPMVANARHPDDIAPVPVLVVRVPVGSVLCRRFDLDRTHSAISALIAGEGVGRLDNLPAEAYVRVLRKGGCLRVFDDIPASELELITDP